MSEGQGQGRRTWRLQFGFDRFSGIYLFALFIVVFGIWKPSLFLTQDTLHSVASQQAIAAMLSLAVLVPLAAGAYDLSVGATANLSAIMAAVFMSNDHWGMWPAIFVSVGAGVVIGVVNGFVVVRLGVSSFIATLGMGSIVAAVQTIISGQTQPLPPSNPGWSSLTQLSVGGFQIVVLYLLVLALLCWWVLDHTPAGRYLYAVGGNSEAARLSGVRTDRLTWWSLIASGLIAGVAGVFYSSQSGPSLTFGPTLLLPAFAAAFLGSTQLKPGRFNVWGTMIAIYVLATGVKGLQLVTSQQWLNDMFNGVALIGAVAFAIWRQKKTVRQRTHPGTVHPAPEHDGKPPPGSEAAPLAVGTAGAGDGGGDVPPVAVGS